MVNNHINSLQALRGVAALFVVLLHLAGGINEYYGSSFFTAFFSFGHCGVDIFFVISGFIMMWVHKKDINHPEQWIHYIKRRIWRIYPTYWIAFLFPFCLYLAEGRIGSFKEISTLNAIKSFFLFPQEGRTVLVVSWTLVYEMVFYLFFGLLILNKKVGIISLASWLCSILIFNFLIPLPIHISTSSQFLDLRNLEFFIGMLIALIVQKHEISFQKILWKSAVAVLFTGIVCNYFYPITHYFLVVIPTTLFLLGTTQPKNDSNYMPKSILSLGTISYSLYLTHVPILLLSYKIFPNLDINNPLLAFLLSLMFCISGGYIFYHLIEKTCLQNKNRKVEKRLRAS